jgi:Ser/Thr protein kinase RdoA (MazF antagonist)
MQSAAYAYEAASDYRTRVTGVMTDFSSVAREALIYYGLNFAEATLVNATNNAVYRVDAGTHQYALRVHRPGLSRRSWIQAELTWLKALRQETNLRVPQPAAPIYEGTGDDHPVYCTLFRWEAGKAVTPTAMTEMQAYTVGVFAATLHQHELPYMLDRPHRDWEGLFGERSSYKPTPEGEALITAEQRRIIAEATAHVKTVMDALDEHREANYGMIHADLIAKNLLFDGDEVVALDFDDCGCGYYLYDLAPMLLAFKDEQHGEVLRNALWAGYNAVRPQPEHHEGYLEALIAARHIASIRWVAGNPSIRDRAAGIIADRVNALKRFLELGRL